MLKSITRITSALDPSSQFHPSHGHKVIFEKAQRARTRTVPPKRTPRDQWPDLIIIPCRRGGRIAGEPSHIYQWGPPIVGQVGHVFDKAGPRTYAFTGSIPGVRRKLLKIPGVKPHQTGDREFTVVFPESAFDAVAAIVRPRRKRPTNKAGADALASYRQAKGLSAPATHSP